jgi:hypothetical protein
MGKGGQLNDSAIVPPEKRPGTHFKGAGWAPATVLKGVESFDHIGIRFPDRPARRKSVYRLRYTDPFCNRLRFKFAESTGVFTC